MSVAVETNLTGGAVAAAEPIRSLEAVLAYEQPDVVDRFLESFAVTREEAEQLFGDVKRWLWCCAVARRRAGRDLQMFVGPSLVMLDEMWHTFILFTREYQRFCEEYLGEFVHHAPTTAGERAAEAALGGTVEQRERRLRSRYEALISFVVDNLGPDVASRWFSEYAKKYPAAELARLHRNKFAES